MQMGGRMTRHGMDGMISLLMHWAKVAPRADVGIAGARITPPTAPRKEAVRARARIREVRVEKEMEKLGQVKVGRAREEEEEDPKVGAGIVGDPIMPTIALLKEKARALAKEVCLHIR